MSVVIYQVDAFANRFLGGNPAGVVPDAQDLSDKEMKKIAREMNLSETAFVMPVEDEEADFELRFFTPSQEVDLCGHATIGAFFVLAEKGYIECKKHVDCKSGTVMLKQKTKAGILPVEIEFEDRKVKNILMTQKSPEYVGGIDDIDELCKAMGIEKEDIGLRMHDIKPQIVSTGLKDIILPVKSIQIIKDMNPDMKKLSEYSRKKGVVGVHVFTDDSEEENSDFATRNFAPYVGIDEESATGTSNGALAAYLHKNKVIDISKRSDYVFEQGYYMERPSKIVVRLQETGDDLNVKVGGTAIITFEGVMKCYCDTCSHCTDCYYG